MLRIDEQCTCPLCLEVLQEPVILSCSHNLCYSCANVLISSNVMKERESKLLTCPICRGYTVLTAPTADCLSKNLILRNLIADWQSTIEFSSSVVCQLCSEDPVPAKFECITCELTACERCAEGHITKPRFKHHKMLSLAKLSKELCCEHRLELDLFCMEDYMLCCLKCAQFTERHRGHKLVTREEARKAFQGHISESKKVLNETVEKAQWATEELQTVIGRMEDYKAAHMEQLGALKEKLIGEVHSNHANTVEKLENCYGTVIGDITEKIRMLQKVSKDTTEIFNSHDELFLLQKSHEMRNLNPKLVVKGVPDVLLFVRENTGFHKALKSLCDIELRKGNLNESNRLYYLSRGSKEYHIYDIETDNFTAMEIRGTELIPRWSGFATLPNGNILVTGGKPSKESGAKVTAFLLNPNRGETYPVPNMLSGHSSHIILRVEEKVYCISGKNQANMTHNICEFYDIYTNSWNMIAPMISGRTCASGVQLGKFLYAMGGYQSSVNSSIEKYDVNCNIWSYVPVNLPENLWQHSCYRISENQMLIFGGEGPIDEPHRYSYIFNPETNDFYNTANLPTYSTWLFFWLHIIRKDNCLYSMNKEKNVLKYSIEENAWHVLKSS